MITLSPLHILNSHTVKNLVPREEGKAGKSQPQLLGIQVPQNEGKSKVRMSLGSLKEHLGERYLHLNMEVGR